jgi:uncharacterized protein (TIGR00725 family)
MRKPIIGVVGTSNDNSPAVDMALKLGRLIAQEQWILLNGGRNRGVMRAASQGAKEVPGSITVGILPSESAEISPDIDIAVITGIQNARNNIITLSSDVVIACGIEGAGTVSEVALALKNSKSVIAVNASAEAQNFFRQVGNNAVLHVQTPEEAIAKAKDLLRGT